MLPNTPTLHFASLCFSLNLRIMTSFDADPIRDQRPLALWAAPRALSHAFEKMMRCRNDHVIFSEPFNDAWYYGPERMSHRKPEKEIPDLYYLAILRKIMHAAERGPVFIRSQPWQFGEKYLTNEILTKFHGFFLIRDPAYSFPSLYKLKPDFREEEGGVIGLHKTWNMLLAVGENPVIIDAIDIQRNPEPVIGAWCDAMGMERRPDALHWEKGLNDAWKTWPKFAETVSNSTGFLKPPENFPTVATEELARKIDAARVLYREMECKKLVI